MADADSITVALWFWQHKKQLCCGPYRDCRPFIWNPNVYWNVREKCEFYLC